MFRFEGFIDDKDVVALHYAMARLKTFEFDCRPAINIAVEKKGKVKDATAGGTMPELITVELRKSAEGSMFDRKAIFEIAKKLGFSPNSTLLTNLIKMKAIKKKARGQFVVLPASK